MDILSFLPLLQTALELGLICSITVLALFLSYSMLNVCDLSTDGCFTLGAAVGAVVALVDALPMLGVGTILIPWGLIVMLQGNSALGFGLLALYVAASMTRSVLEPRMVGRQLGLNPLTTLAVVYVGYKLWGILGMILAPVLAVTVAQLWAMLRPASQGNAQSP